MSGTKVLTVPFLVPVAALRGHAAQQPQSTRGPDVGDYLLNAEECMSEIKRQN